jgi:hypothetical protein
MTAPTNSDAETTSSRAVVVSDACSPFEFEAIGAQFECTHAIYPTGGQASICYVTSEQRARLIVAALNHFKESGKLDEWISAENATAHARANLKRP